MLRLLLQLAGEFFTEITKHETPRNHYAVQPEQDYEEEILRKYSTPGLKKNRLDE